MTPPKNKSRENKSRVDRLSPEQIKQLRAEVRSPYKSIRRFFYIAFALSGSLGAYIFLMKVLSGNITSSTIPNFFLQILLTLAMVGLFWLERDKKSE